MLGKKLPLPDDNAGGKPKSKIEAVIATTPVVMTVLATLLAGLSSSEMTQAQYYRSLAAQFQSKAGDQWGFFQAKRIRGSGLEQAVDILRPSGESIERALPATVAQLQMRIRRSQKSSEQLSQSLTEGVVRVDFVASKPALQKATEKLRAAMRDHERTAKVLADKIARRLETSETKQTLTFLGSKAIPEGASAQVERPRALADACQAVRDRKSDQEIALILASLSRVDLDEAIEDAAAEAAAFEKRTKPATRDIDDLGKLVTATASLARSIQSSLRGFTDTVDLGAQDLPGPMGYCVSDLERAGTAARTAADNLQADFKAARHGFKARCYEHEARQNQAVAELYELQVRLNSVASERHRQRSKNFFYGMLLAQAGVTIASLSLAVQHKSVLWSLASATGLGAILFGGYVYLCM